MQETLNRMRAKKADEGFTLIELLVVVVIIGVLVAIAVPVYLNYRQGAADKSAQSDVRGAVSAVEQFYTDNNNTADEITGTAQVNAAITITKTAPAPNASYSTTPDGAGARVGGVRVGEGHAKHSTMHLLPSQTPPPRRPGRCASEGAPPPRSRASPGSGS